MTVAAIGRLLRNRGERIAVVETSAGGLISARLAGVPGASSWFAGSVNPYSAASRQAWLGLGDLAGVVSEETAIAFATAARDRLGVEWAIGETGIAGPQTGRRSTKPAGMTCLAVVGPAGTVSQTVTLPDHGRKRNMAAFASAAIGLLASCLAQERSLA